MKTNEYAKMTNIVKTILDDYHNVLKECKLRGTDFKGLSIERKANLFIDNCFTLAVIGKVSSGKSTFINALLGCKDLLPTGHDQTTCGITSIEYGEKPEVVISFGDGSNETIKGEDISGKIKPYVAIPDKYHHLPVNDLDDFIMANYTFEKIWEVKDQIEKRTLCPPIDKDLLREYINGRSKKNIAIKVQIKYPFAEELKGWRIIDTPGVGAIGGIENKTRSLLNEIKPDGSRVVDAIIFLQNGSLTLDEKDTKEFISTQVNTLSEADKKRLFYVLTHSADTDFLNHKTEKLEAIQKNYGKDIKNLSYADGLLAQYINEVKSKDIDLKHFDDIEKLENWLGDEWDVVQGILFQAKQALKKNGEAVNNETMLALIQDWANFESLKKSINEFAKKEKKDTLNEFIKLVKDDYKQILTRFKNDSSLLTEGEAKIQMAIDNVKKKQQELNAKIPEIENKVNVAEIERNFDFISNEMVLIDKANTIGTCRANVTNLFDRVRQKEKTIFTDLKRSYLEHLGGYADTDYFVGLIDFDNIEREATNSSQEEYVISPARVISHTSSPDEHIPAKYGKRTNEAKKLEEFKALVLKRVRSQRDLLFNQIREKTSKIKNLIRQNVKGKIESETSRLETLKSELHNSEQNKKNLERFTKIVQDSTLKLNDIIKNENIEIHD